MDDIIKCEKCDKTFPYISQLNRHINKKLPCTPRSKTCEYCNTTFATVGGLTRHLRDVCYKEEEKYYKEHNIHVKLQEMEFKFEIDKKAIEDLREAAKNQLININGNNNNNTTNNTNNNQIVNNNNNNVTVNVLTKEYVKENFTGDPCLKELENYNIIREGNLITDPYHSDENIMFINTLVSQYTRGKLVEYIGNILVSYYKKPNKIADQALWCSDLSRMTFLVRILPVATIPRNKWVDDPSGLVVKEKVILPLLNYVVKCIDTYRIKYPLTMITETDKHITLGEIVEQIRNNVLTTQITKYMAPHFALRQQLQITNNDDKPKEPKARRRIKDKKI
jgi:hypothetical protein